MPLLAAIMPPLLALVMTRYGLPATYALMAAIGGLLLIVALFVVAYPPQGYREAVSGPHVAASSDSGMTNRELLRSGNFWGIVAAFAAMVMGASVMSAHIVPLAMGWGIDATRAATLLSFSSIGGMAGAITWGWIAERLGGVRVLGILCLCGSGLWLMLLLQPSYPFFAAIALLMGFTGARLSQCPAWRFHRCSGSNPLLALMVCATCSTFHR
jgi:hypothetical protein